MVESKIKSTNVCIGVVAAPLHTNSLLSFPPLNINTYFCPEYFQNISTTEHKNLFLLRISLQIVTLQGIGHQDSTSDHKPLVGAPSASSRVKHWKGGFQWELDNYISLDVSF